KSILKVFGIVSSHISDIALDNFQFFIIPDTLKSSKTIIWFSQIISVDNLCRKFVFISFSLA
ncbi:MAG: hypothetical protein O4805_11540, partial [Trichodesmium sp. St16_bin2-tuft]|nr:hypothetical protein [Trichodesmium sp. St16_bin2-tuft]